MSFPPFHGQLHDLLWIEPLSSDTYDIKETGFGDIALWLKPRLHVRNRGTVMGINKVRT